MIGNDYCKDLECLEMLGAWTSDALIANDTDPAAAVNSALGDERLKDYANQAMNDAEDAFDMDTKPLKGVLDVNNVGQIENTWNQMQMEDQKTTSEDETWLGGAMDAFWTGFTGGRR